MIENIRQELAGLADEKYREFNRRLIPGVDDIMGVRLPHLHRIAKKIAKGDWRKFLRQASDSVYEERILRALVIGYVRTDLEETLELIRDFVPRIDNWAVCDAFSGKIPVLRKNRNAFLKFLLPYLASDKEYYVRFGMIMLLAYFVEEDYIDRTLALIDEFNHEGYYARMGTAWTLSKCYFDFPDKTVTYLKHSNLDNWTYNKAIQKMIESRTLTDEERDMLRGMKRK